ncbi:hypothetical protein DFP72DRAFT_842367 [Ephemerocybe angulata]|uniref:Uncharacterized protein n=1 Tax=Ephemerocybe angulata TaxID=980116 RepID=A0A8H6IBV7_9AGAR|nr:hypothetical protein DFP72DRAFT_842367 [Tulosesus angulatus]
MLSTRHEYPWLPGHDPDPHREMHTASSSWPTEIVKQAALKRKKIEILAPVSDEGSSEGEDKDSDELDPECQYVKRSHITRTRAMLWRRKVQRVESGAEKENEGDPVSESRGNKESEGVMEGIEPAESKAIVDGESSDIDRVRKCENVVIKNEAGGGKPGAVEVPCAEDRRDYVTVQYHLIYEGYPNAPEWNNINNINVCAHLIAAYWSMAMKLPINVDEARNAQQLWASSVDETQVNKIEELLDKKAIVGDYEALVATLETVANIPASCKTPTFASTLESWNSHWSKEAIHKGFLSLIDSKDHVSQEMAKLLHVVDAAHSLPAAAADAALGTFGGRSHSLESWTNSHYYLLVVPAPAYGPEHWKGDCQGACGGWI